MLTRYAAPGQHAIIAGDCNSIAPDCPGHQPEREPEWDRLPPHKRHHKSQMTGDGQFRSDRRALARLASAGLANAGCLAGNVTPTVYPDVDSGQGARIDHILVSPALAPAVIPRSYTVHSSQAGRQASDHRMISVQLDLARVQRDPAQVVT